MKNLFDYATKELAQDAFLRWIFENYEDAELGKVARKLLKVFCQLPDDETIKELHTTAQWNKIDISVWITTSKRKIALFIEDKTFSSEHNQLESYNKHIDCITEYESIYKIFYKTTRIEQWEYERLREASKLSPIYWRSFDIRDTVFQFDEFANSNNIILSQYVEHIKKVYSALCNTDKPSKNDNKIDYIKWASFFDNRVVVELKKVFGEDIITWVWQGGRYPYSGLGIKKSGYSKDIPYLEIRSRDCIDNSISAKILCYGMSDTDVKQQQKLIEKIYNDEIYSCKFLRTYKKGKENYFPKQIGKASQNNTVKSDEKFIEILIEYVKRYVELLNDWQ